MFAAHTTARTSMPLEFTRVSQSNSFSPLHFVAGASLLTPYRFYQCGRHSCCRRRPAATSVMTSIGSGFESLRCQLIETGRRKASSKTAKSVWTVTSKKCSLVQTRLRAYSALSLDFDWLRSKRAQPARTRARPPSQRAQAQEAGQRGSSSAAQS